MSPKKEKGEKKWSKFLPAVAQKLFLLVFFVAVFVFFIRPVGGDGDFFHHLNTGRYVLQNISLPQVDDFTFTAKGQHWVAYSWGSGVIFYLIYNYFGPIGVNFLVAGLALLTFALLYLWLRSYSVPRSISLLVLVLAVSPISVRWLNRPELFTYPFIISFFLLDRFRQRYPRIVLLYPLLTLLWANLYGASVLLGIIVLGILAIKQLYLDQFKVLPTQRLFYIVSLVSLPIAFFNGYGSETVFYIFLVPKIARIQGEWAGLFTILTKASIDQLIVFQYRLLIYFLYLAFFLLVIILSLKRIWSYLFLVILASAVFIPFLIFRHTPLAIILSTPLLSVLLAQFVEFKRRILFGLTAFVALFSLIIAFWINPLGLGQDNDSFPDKLIEFIKNNDLSGRAFTSQQIGAFLSYHFYPKILVHWDTRDDLFLKTDVMDDFYNTFPSQKSVMPLLDKYEVDLVVADLAEGFSYQPLFYSQDWVIVFLSGHHIVALNREIAQEKNLPILDAIDPFSPTNAKSGKEAAAVRQHQDVFLLQPDSLNNKIRLAYALFGNKQFDKAIQIASQIRLDKSPKSALFAEDRDYLLSQAYFAKGDCPRTKQYLDQTERNVSKKLIFTPNKTLPSLVNRGYVFYYLVCMKDQNKAYQFLRLFLAQPDIPNEIKFKTRDQFNQLINQLTD